MIMQDIVHDSKANNVSIFILNLHKRYLIMQLENETACCYVNYFLL
jgi:hypothetical protein